MSACFSNPRPTTTKTNGQASTSAPSSQLRKVPAAQRVQIHSLMIIKTTPPNASSATALEFALVDPREQTDENETSWCAHGLDQVGLARLLMQAFLRRARAQPRFSRLLRPVLSAAG